MMSRKFKKVLKKLKKYEASEVAKSLCGLVLEEGEKGQ